MHCQNCKKRPATVHLTDLVQGDKRERHLCAECAATEGVMVKHQTSINDVLNNFLASQADIQELARLRCPECGTSFVEFRNQGVLGCAHDYDVFGEALISIIERAQDGRHTHAGKTPGEVVRIDPVQQERLEVQRELRDAVEREDYERAAELRDRLGELSGE